MKPKISVVLITYNHERYIEKAIESILNQETDFDFEIIVGDDNSPDNTAEILYKYYMQYPEKIRLYLREENLGPTRNLYDLFSKCNGEYIAILEGDDYWTSNEKLQIQVDFLENNKDFIATTHIVEYINENDRVFAFDPTLKYDELSDETTVIKCQYEGLTLGHFQSFVFRNIFYDRAYEELITCSKFIGDIQLKYLLISLGKIKHIPIVMGRYRQINNSTSYNSLDWNKKMQFAFEVWDKINEFSEYKDSKLIEKVKDNYRIVYFKKLMKNYKFKKATLYFINECSFSCKKRIIKEIVNEFCKK